MSGVTGHPGDPCRHHCASRRETPASSSGRRCSATVRSGSGPASSWCTASARSASPFAFDWPLTALLYDADRDLSAWARDVLSAAVAGDPVHAALAAELMAELGEKDEGAPELIAVAALPPDSLARLAGAACADRLRARRRVRPSDGAGQHRDADPVGRRIRRARCRGDRARGRSVRPPVGSCQRRLTVRRPGRSGAVASRGARLAGRRFRPSDLSWSRPTNTATSMWPTPT